MTKCYLRYEDSNYLLLKLNKRLLDVLDKILAVYSEDEDEITKDRLFKLHEDELLGISALIGRGYEPYLRTSLSKLGYELIFKDNQVVPSIKITDYWRSVLDTDYRVVYGRNQYSYLEQILTESPRSTNQFYTGYGKTPLQVAIVESYLEMYPDKNALILVPTHVIKDEFYKTFSKFDTKYSPEYSGFNTRLQLINPIGFLNSKRCTDQSVKDYLDNVGLILIDEVHRMTASSYKIFLDEYCYNYDYIYGFSGTIDSDDGELPSSDYDPTELSLGLNQIISYLGTPVVEVSNPNKLLVSYLRFESTNVPKKLRFNYGVAIKILLGSDDLLLKLTQFLYQNPDRKVFFTIFQKKQGKNLVDKLNNLLGHGSAVLKTSSGTYPKISSTTNDLLYKYPNLESYLESDKFRIILGTSALYEGFDSKVINTVFLPTGSSQRMTLQPTGRSTRGYGSTDPLILLPWDTTGNNPIINLMTKKKFNRLKSSYKNLKFILNIINED